MNFIFNGNTPEHITYNNNNVAKLVYNGSDVWYEKIQYTADETTFPMTLTKTLPYNAIDYNIYGNTVRTGTPSKENPAQITHVGNLVTDINDAHYGEYAIPVTISDSNNQISTVNIYLDEPLRSLLTESDYIDFENQKVVRIIKEIVFKGNENWTKTSSGSRPAYYRYGVGNTNRPGTQNSNTQISNYFAYGAPTTRKYKHRL